MSDKQGFHIAAAAIRRWQLTVVLFVMVAALGLLTLLSIPRSVSPHFPVPVTFIGVSLPGAGVETMERTVTRPIEKVLQGLDNIQKIDSTTKDGSAFIVAWFDWNGDPETYFNDIVREVTAIRPQLPEGIAFLNFKKARTTNAVALQVAIVSETASARRMEKYARDLSEAFSRHPAVRGSEVHGLPAAEAQVVLDPQRLAELRLPPSAVAEAIRLASIEVPPGQVTSASRSFNVRAGGAFGTLQDIRDTPIRTAAGTSLTIGDVATVGWGTEEERVQAFHNGERAVFVTATQKFGTDVIRLRKGLIETLEAKTLQLPPDMRFELQLDQSQDIASKMSELLRDFAIAVVLVFITLLPLGFRTSVIVAVSIPLSLACGLIGVYLTGSNLNQLVIGSFVLTLGLLVDDSIVVTENIARHLRMGKDSLRAALDGVREVTPAVAGSTAVLVFAFMPMLALPDGPGVFIRSFVYTTIFTICASMVVSLTLVPFLATFLLRPHRDGEDDKLLGRINRAIEGSYAPLLHRTLARPRRYVAVMAAAMAVVVALILPTIGATLFPYADTAYFRVEIEAETGSSLQQTRAVTRQVERVLNAEAAIKVQALSVGANNPQVYYTVFPTGQYPSKAEIIAVMDGWRGAESQAVIDRLQAGVARIPGAQIRVLLYQNGSPVTAPVSIRVTGPDLGMLKQAAARIERILLDTPGARDVVNPLATDAVELNVGIDERKAALLDVPAGTARRAIRLALNGERAGSIRDQDGDTYPITVRVSARTSNDLSALARAYVPNRAGELVRLDQLSRPTLQSAPPEIARLNQQRIVQVNAQTTTGALPADVARAALDRSIETLQLPPGYSIGLGGEAEEIANLLSGFLPVVLLALFLIFTILVAEFRRFRDTIVVAAVIPLGLFGGVLALWLSGNSFSFLAAIGFVALIGIEIKNSILLVDFTNQLRAAGMPLKEAIEEAGKTRFLPVLLTSVTAFGGLLPLALLGGSLYSPLAWVIMGGLVSSTLLSRLIIPAVYLMIVK